MQRGTGRGEEAKGKKEEFEKALQQAGALDHLDFHKKSLEEVLASLDTNQEEGLSEEKAREKLNRVGPNKLKERATRSWYVKLLIEMFGLFQNLLWVAAALSFLGYGLTPSDNTNVLLPEC